MKFLTYIKKIITPPDFRRQLVAVLIGGIISTAIISTFFISEFTSSAVSKNLLEEGKKITETFASQSILGLLVSNVENVEDSVTAILNFPGVEGVGVYDLDKKPLVERGKDTLTSDQPVWSNEVGLVKETDEAWYFVAPVYYLQELEEDAFDEQVQPELLGHVRVVQSKEGLILLISKIRKVNIIISLGLAAALMVLLLMVTQRVTKPLQELMRLMRRAQSGETDVRAELSGPRDIREMEAAFNTMIKSLQDREVQLETARDDAIQSARIKGDFAANVSHELRTPLNGILGMLELLSGMGLTVKQREYVNIARNSSDALLALIDDILDFSRIDSGKLVVDSKEFNLRELLDDVVSIMASQAQSKNLDLAHLICTSVPNSVMGDSRRIRQLLLNLCGNAIKFTSSGEIGIHVNLMEARGSDICLRFEVKDTGIGIAESAKEKIFDAFSQADGSTTRKFGGTGLGLAICKQLVSVLDGKIGVDSAVGEGSTFWFELPMRLSNTNCEMTRDAQGSMDLRVLVVDDSEIVQFNIQQTFEKWGAYVECADSSDSALLKLRHATHTNKPFDVALIDELMPGCNGIELMRSISRNPEVSLVKMLLMTNQAHAESFLERFVEIDGFVQKPVLQSSLYDSISTVMKGSMNIINPLFTEEVDNNDNSISAHILVAEDNAANQQVAIGMLERLGCSVIVASNGIDATNLLERNRFDLVFMDCNMPEMDGYQATLKIRTTGGKSAGIPIIAMTANVQEGDRQKCLQAGMDDYLSKPLKLDRIRAKLEQWLPDVDENENTVDGIPVVDVAQPGVTGPIDEERIEELRDSVASAFDQMVKAYVEDLPILVTSLEDAVNSKDAEQVQHFAHSIKGSSKNFGAVELANVSKEIEDMGRANELQDANTQLIALFEEVDRVIEYLNKLIDPEYSQTLPTSEVRASDQVDRVLIADDDRSMRLALMNVLDSDGYELHEVENGQEALQYCQNNMPDLVLLDAMMPEMDGFTACEEIRTLENGSHIPILIVTALDDEESVERAFKVGATDYLPKPVHFAVLRQRISRLLHAASVERHVRQLAYTDPLTGLPNRTTLSKHLNELLGKAYSSNDMVAMLFLDLDRFKLVNDTLGHSVGDLLLKAVADRLQRCVRSGDMVARLGGDEFTIIVDRAKSRDSVARIAQTICDSIEQPFSFSGQEIFVSTSIGISLYPLDGDNIGDLMKHADTAMFRAKEVGRSYFFYESDMEAAVTRKMEIEADLRRSVSRDQIDVYFQPKADLKTNQIVGMEALVRWNHPQKGIICPQEFIPLAEETGIINEIGLWVMIGACLQIKDWIDQGFGPYSIAVNLSGVQLENGEIINQVKQVLDETQIDPSLLELEITESTIMHNPERVIEILQRLKDMGVQLAVDDFGTGYSSLNYLKRFPIDLLKIDAAFVRDVETDADDRAIVQSIIALAKSMRLKVVAEGVETRQQQEFLKALDCDYIQGYYIGRPVCAEEFEERILKNDQAGSTAIRELSDYRES
ncbi:MAG: EAL domain-containing protein [Gammaproteobacteria bacterium]|nr:EAL domain-containing protein [Gammaproteobacteria bacterium]